MQSFSEYRSKDITISVVGVVWSQFSTQHMGRFTLHHLPQLFASLCALNVCMLCFKGVRSTRYFKKFYDSVQTKRIVEFTLGLIKKHSVSSKTVERWPTEVPQKGKGSPPPQVVHLYSGHEQTAGGGGSWPGCFARCQRITLPDGRLQPLMRLFHRWCKLRLPGWKGLSQGATWLFDSVCTHP